MSYTRYLQDLLRPLGVYQMNAPFFAGELHAQGAALDLAEHALEEVHRESVLSTASDWGLERFADLFARKPAAQDAQSLANALAALLRISGDSFTPDAIQDTITGCGIPAHVEETGVGQVTVSFPGVPGVPEGFDQMKLLIEDILPVHLDVRYAFWFLSWSGLEQKFPDWRALETNASDWNALETSTA